VTAGTGGTGAGGMGAGGMGAGGAGAGGMGSGTCDRETTRGLPCCLRFIEDCLGAGACQIEANSDPPEICYANGVKHVFPSASPDAAPAPGSFSRNGVLCFTYTSVETPEMGPLVRTYMNLQGQVVGTITSDGPSYQAACTGEAAIAIPTPLTSPQCSVGTCD
jgi:hypothetical protein